MDEKAPESAWRMAVKTVTLDLAVLMVVALLALGGFVMFVGYVLTEFQHAGTEEYCPMCSGRGYFHDAGSCPECDGTGLAPEERP